MHSLTNLTHKRESQTRKKTARVCWWKEGHHKPTKRNKTQTIYKHTHIMHSLTNLTHKRESRTRKKMARVCCWKEGHQKPAKRNKTDNL